jgi:tRNA(Ile)-lysidine synthase
MKRSHAPALIKLVLRTVLDERLFSHGDIVLVAVSGGPDSIALLHVLSRLAQRLGIALVAHGVDHGLREEAASELALAGRIAEGIGVPFATTRVEVAPGSNLMARARQARYEALTRAKERAGACLMATGHHADDRAETVLMRILRGTGPSGLAVLASRSADRVRPLVRARRHDVLLHLERHHLPYASDPTNGDPRFLRSRVRCELLPLLERLSPRIVEHLCALADAAGAPLDTPARAGGRPLGRAQRTLLSRALCNKNPLVRVPLAGGKVATVDLHTGQFVVMDDG